MTRTMQMMSIGEVAQAVGLASSTLRYYEQENLLAPTMRSDAGYRFYDAQAVERLRFIRAAQAAGFTLNDIRTLLELESENRKVCENEVQPIIRRRIAEIDRKMKDLKRVRAELGRALDRCRGSNGECAVLKDLRPTTNKRRSK